MRCTGHLHSHGHRLATASDATDLPTFLMATWKPTRPGSMQSATNLSPKTSYRYFESAMHIRGGKMKEASMRIHCVTSACIHLLKNARHNTVQSYTMCVKIYVCMYVYIYIYICINTCACNKVCKAEYKVRTQIKHFKYILYHTLAIEWRHALIYV
jgi:hypothetical protein